MLKMDKLVGLAFTYVDSASSENEFLTAGKMGRKMIEKELGCPHWVAGRILHVLAKKESWFPRADRMHLHGILPTNASEIFENALKALGIRYTKEDYGFGGVAFKRI